MISFVDTLPESPFRRFVARHPFRVFDKFGQFVGFFSSEECAAHYIVKADPKSRCYLVFPNGRQKSYFEIAQQLR